MVRQIWMSLPWEVPQRLLHSDRQRIHGIQSMYREDLQVVPVQQLQQKNVHMHWVLIPVDQSASQVHFAVLPVLSRPMERYPVMV